MGPESSQLEVLMNALLSDNNNVRHNAEDTFEHLKSSSKDALLLQLLRVLRQGPEAVSRQQAATLIQNTLSDFIKSRKDDWTNLGMQTKEGIKRELIASLDSETDKKVRNVVCSLTASIGSKLLAKEQWPELIGTVISFIESPNTMNQAVGLRLLSELVPFVSEMIHSSIGTLNRMVLSCAKSNDMSVRVECLGFVSSLIENESRTVWKNMEVAGVFFLEGLDRLVQMGDNQLALEMLMLFSDIAEESITYFKSCIDSLTLLLLKISSSSKDTHEDLRNLAIEVLLCLVEEKPQMCLKIPSFMSNLVRTLFELMLSFQDIETNPMALMDDASLSEETKNFDIGEVGLHRIAAAGYTMDNQTIIKIIYEYISQYLLMENWCGPVVALVAIAQTAPYIPEDNFDQFIHDIVSTLISKMSHSHFRVRFAALQALEQLSLDQQPEFQKASFTRVYPSLIQLFDDERVEIRCRAITAFVFFTEELDVNDLLAYVEPFIEKLLGRISAIPVKETEHCLSGVAAIAGVLGNLFVKYYPVITPVIKEIIRNCVAKEQRMLRGKAAESLAIIGLSVGKEVFARDAHEIIQILLPILNEDAPEEDPLKEYANESLSRICRVLKSEFVPYIQCIIPLHLRVLSVKPMIVDEDDVDVEKVSLIATPDGQLSGVKTSDIHEITDSLQQLSNYVECLGCEMAEYLEKVAEAVLPLLEFPFQDVVKRKALSTMTRIVEATISYRNANPQANVLDTVKRWIKEILLKVFNDFKNEESDQDLLISEASGLAQCLSAAGSEIFEPGQVSLICNEVYSLIQSSSQREESLQKKKSHPEYDEEDIMTIEREENIEQELRLSLAEIFSPIMKFYTDEFVQTCLPQASGFIERYLAGSRQVVDKVLAIHFCDDVLQHLKHRGAVLWPIFAEQLVAHLQDRDPRLRQATAFGIVQAAQCPEFPQELIQRAATSLVSILSEHVPRKTQEIEAQDNALAALGSILIHRRAQLQPSVAEYAKIWVEKLPLKEDQEEAANVHASLLEMLIRRDADILGPNNEYLEKHVAICATIYGTDVSNQKIDEGIRYFLNSIGFDVVQAMGANFSKEVKNSVETIHRDIINKGSFAEGYQGIHQLSSQ